MDKVCQCCGMERTGSRCGYCGFREVIDIDGSSTELINSLAEVHRAKLAESITDISVMVYEYSWNQTSLGLEQQRIISRRLTDGKNCYPQMVWGKVKLGQQEPGQQFPLQLSYRINGTTKELQIPMTPVRCKDFWKLGIQIDRTLHLRIFLGTEDRYAISEPVPIEWVTPV